MLRALGPASKRANSFSVQTTIEYEIDGDQLRPLSSFQPSTTALPIDGFDLFIGDYQIIMIHQHKGDEDDRPNRSHIQVFRRPDWNLTPSLHYDGLVSYEYAGDHLITYNGSELRIWDVLK